LVTVIPLCFKDVDSAGIIRKLGSVANIWRMGVPGKCQQHPEVGSTFARKEQEG